MTNKIRALSDELARSLLARNEAMRLRAIAEREEKSADLADEAARLARQFAASAWDAAHCQSAKANSLRPPSQIEAQLKQISGEFGEGEMAPVAQRFESLPPIERSIASKIIARLEMGLKQYGEFPATDKRDFAAEALDEVLDAQIYSARALLGDTNG
jgi:hypothetical protein